MTHDKVIEYIAVFFFTGLGLYFFRLYIVNQTKKHALSDADVTMKDLKEYCLGMQSNCIVHQKIERLTTCMNNIDARLKRGDDVLSKHTDAINKLDPDKMKTLFDGHIQIQAAMLETQKNIVIKLLELDRCKENKHE